MTDTMHPVSRRTVDAHPRHKRRIKVTIGPGDTIAFQLERDRRSPFHLPIDKLYDQAELKAASAMVNFSTAPRSLRARNVRA